MLLSLVTVLLTGCIVSCLMLVGLVFGKIIMTSAIGTGNEGLLRCGTDRKVYSFSVISSLKNSTANR